MIVLEYNLDRERKKILKLLDSVTLNKSSQEVQFSDITVDFTGSSAEELPYNYQELRIWEVGEDLDISKGKLLYTGYMDGNRLPRMVNTIEDVRMEVSMLSPKAMTTRRYVSASGTYYLTDLFTIILQPLLQDGFTIKEIDVGTHIKTANYFVQTIESIMNDLSHTYNFFWYIDEQKGIYITEVNKLMGKESKMLIKGAVENMLNIQPTVKSFNYFNAINIKNARVYCNGFNQDGGWNYQSNTYPMVETLQFNKEDNITFKHPFDIDKDNLKKLCLENNETMLFPFQLSSNTKDLFIRYNLSDDSLTMSNGIVFDDQDTTNAIIILTRDPFFNNLIIGFRWNVTSEKIFRIASSSMLKYQTVKMYYTQEIEKCKGIISDSGIVENVIDVNERWFTRKELIEYCRSLMTSNGNQTTDVQISFDKDKGLKIGDMVEIDMPEFLTVGNFIITSISESHTTGDDLYTLKLKNSKFQTNYLDFFRSPQGIESESNYDITNIVEYQEESINEVFEEVL